MTCQLLQRNSVKSIPSVKMWGTASTRGNRNALGPQGHSQLGTNAETDGPE